MKKTTHAAKSAQLGVDAQWKEREPGVFVWRRWRVSRFGKAWRLTGPEQKLGTTHKTRKAAQDSAEFLDALLGSHGKPARRDVKTVRFARAVQQAARRYRREGARVESAGGRVLLANPNAQADCREIVLEGTDAETFRESAVRLAGDLAVDTKDAAFWLASEFWE